jgi:C-terminal processing protease CtpA/Prc
MRRIKILVLTMLILLSCQGQTDQKFNLGFEKQSQGNVLPDGWFQWGDFALSTDQSSHSGQKSGKITSGENGKFGSIAYKIPALYSGKTIELHGYMKIRNVEDGFAGLLLRVDGNEQTLAFDNMEDRNVTGTKDWEEYTIKLEYPEQARQIFIAGLLTGKGEAWFDDFALFIDGKNVQTLEERAKTVYKALLDTVFDKGSGVEIPTPSPEETGHLTLLGRVWGFLKYHHPAIAKGDINWDYALFRFLPGYLKAADKAGKEELLLEWIDGLGKTDPCTTCKPTPDGAMLKPDTGWISGEVNNEALRNRLTEIYNNRNQGDHFYIRLTPGVGNPVFENENAYSALPYPDAGFRLLALYRYWNMINYFFPYKHLTDKKWDDVLAAYIPVFLQAKNELEYEQAAVRIIGEVHDTHANLWGGNNKIEKWKGNFFAPVHMRFIEGELVVTDYYNPELKSETGPEVGDVIRKIDGKSIKEIIREKSIYYPASNEAARGRDMAEEMLRSQKDVAIIEFVNNGKVVSEKIKLYPRSDLKIYRLYRKDDKKCYRLLDNNIGYITLMSVKENDIAEIRKEFKDTRGIIVDIRNYPSTFVPFMLGSFFVESPTPFVKFTKGNTANPGEFTFSDPTEITPSGETYKGKLVVLVNEITQSQAEYTALALRAGLRTTIIGSTTAGADGNVSSIALPGGLRTMISGIGVNYPNGKETQRVGIVPDIVALPTINGIKNGRDELIEKAVNFILKK